MTYVSRFLNENSFLIPLTNFLPCTLYRRFMFYLILIFLWLTGGKALWMCSEILLGGR